MAASGLPPSGAERPKPLVPVALCFHALPSAQHYAVFAAGPCLGAACRVDVVHRNIHGQLDLSPTPSVKVQQLATFSKGLVGLACGPQIIGRAAMHSVYGAVFFSPMVSSFHVLPSKWATTGGPVCPLVAWTYRLEGLVPKMR